MPNNKVTDSRLSGLHTLVRRLEWQTSSREEDKLCVYGYKRRYCCRLWEKEGEEDGSFIMIAARVIVPLRAQVAVCRKMKQKMPGIPLVTHGSQTSSSSYHEQKGATDMTLAHRHAKREWVVDPFQSPSCQRSDTMSWVRGTDYHLFLSDTQARKRHMYTQTWHMTQDLISMNYYQWSFFFPAASCLFLSLFFNRWLYRGKKYDRIGCPMWSPALVRIRFFSGSFVFLCYQTAVIQVPERGHCCCWWHLQHFLFNSISSPNPAVYEGKRKIFAAVGEDVTPDRLSLSIKTLIHSRLSKNKQQRLDQRAKLIILITSPLLACSQVK